MLQSSGTIKLSQVRTERAAVGTQNLAHSDCRTMAVKPSGAIKMSNLYAKYHEFPQIDAYIYDNATAVNAFLGTYTPPTPLSVFNTWGRFAANTWFPGGTTPTGEATAWQYNSSLSRIECTLNTIGYVGFISVEKLDNYVFEATLSSTSSDDDLIGLVAAFTNDGTNNKALMVVRTNGGVTPSWGISLLSAGVLTVLQNSSPLITTVYKNSALAGWSASGVTRVKVERSGNIISAVSSQFGSTVYDESTRITFDLTSNVNTQSLVGKQSYGYCAQSQLASTFTNSALSGALATDTVYNVATNTWQKYNSTTGLWTTQAGSAATALTYPRKIRNPATGSIYFIDPYGVITKLS